MKNKILIIAAHADDEVLGCGGTVNKFSKMGANIEALFIADGVSSRNRKSKSLEKKELFERKKSCKAATKILGIKKTTFLDLPDNQLDTVPLLKIVKKIEKKILSFKPDTIFTHFDNDLNIDHQIVNKATITACRPIGKKTYPKKIFFFEVPSSTEWQIKKKVDLFNPNWFEDISLNLKCKIDALKAYKKELRKWPHPRSVKGVKSLAHWRGATSGHKAAEAFILGRKI